MIDIRSENLSEEIVQAITRVNAAWQKPQPSAAELSPLVATLTDRYNYGVNLLTTAARKADLTKVNPSGEDLQAARGVRAIQAELKGSFAAWHAGQYKEASDGAARADGVLFTTPTVLGPLKAKALDAALKTALDTYAMAASDQADPAKVSTTYRAGLEA